MDFSATYKVLVLGDSNVGKTCIVHRYCDERYYDTYISTIGIDFKQKLINLDGVPIKLQIWDVSKLPVDVSNCPSYYSFKDCRTGTIPNTDDCILQGRKAASSLIISRFFYMRLNFSGSYGYSSDV